MFICPDSFIVPHKQALPEEQHHAVVVYAKSDNPEENMRISTFVSIVSLTLEAMNNPDCQWDLNKVNVCEGNIRSDCSTVFYSDIIIVDCSSDNSNVFYILGLAHAYGCRVCQCYDKKNQTPIPFNVRGRQGLKYTVNGSDGQEELKKNLQGWIKRCLRELKP